ncbi:MAG: DUF624 domain-containing protein, partial [Turicibacter sp.]
MNETKYLDSKMYRYSNYMAQVLMINFYFIIGTLIGLIGFGIAPSIYASLKLIQEMLDDECDSHLFTRFMQYYRQNFVKANKIWFSYLLVFAVLAINVYYYENQLTDGFFKVGILIVNYLLIFTTFLSFTTYIGIDIRLNYKLKDKVKASILF